MQISDIRNALGYSDKQRFITKAQLSEVFGHKDRRAVDKYVSGLEAVDGKYYLITDVARRLKEKCSGM